MPTRSTPQNSYPRSTRVFTPAVFQLAAILLLYFTWHTAVSAGERSIEITSHYLEDAGQALDPEAALSALRGGQGETLEGLRFNLGNRDSHYWLLFELHNGADEELQRVLDTGVPYRAGLKVFQVRGSNELETLLISDDTASFADRGGDNLILRTRPFTLQAGGSTALLLDYTTRGSTYMPMSLKSVKAFDARDERTALWSAFFYAASLVLLVVFLLLGLGLQDRKVLLYAGLFTLGLLFIAATEGYAFKYLWPQAPYWNQYAALFLLLFTTGISFFVAWAAMHPGTLAPWGKWLIVSLGSISLTLSALCTTLPFSPLIETGSLLMVLSYLTQIATVLSWLKQAMARNLITLVSTLVAVPIIVVLLVLGIFGFDFPDIAFSYSLRTFFLFSVVMTLASLTTHITALRLDHEKSMAQALQAAERDAELSRKVIQSEQRYQKAKEIAAARQRQLASTSHDIRQPLTALRAVVDQLSADLDGKERGVLTRSLDYIEEISRAHIARPNEIHPAEEEKDDSYRADLLLHTVKRMFQAEADSRNVELRVADCSVVIDHSPLVLMRILSNLVSNAVKHGEGGRVLLGCRRECDSLRYEIIDNGVGMDGDELARVTQPYEKGRDSAGEGLGLAICWQLAAEHGFEMRVSSVPGKGSRFALIIPRSRPATTASIDESITA